MRTPRAPLGASVAALGLALSLAACARVPPAPPPAAPLPPEDWVRAAGEHGGAVRALRALYDVEISSDGERHSFEAVAALREGGALRFEVLGPFGGTRVVAVADGRAFAAYEAGERTYFRGRANAENVARVLRVPVEPATLVRVLLGRALLIDPLVAPVASADGPFARLIAADAAGRLQLAWLDPRTARPLRVELNDATGALALTAAFERWSDGAGLPLAVPERLRIDFPATGTRIALELEEVERNPELPAALFRLAKPPGARELDLDAAS